MGLGFATGSDTSYVTLSSEGGAELAGSDVLSGGEVGLGLATGSDTECCNPIKRGRISNLFNYPEAAVYQIEV